MKMRPIQKSYQDLISKDLLCIHNQCGLVDVFCKTVIFKPPLKRGLEAYQKMQLLFPRQLNYT